MALAARQIELFGRNRQAVGIVAVGTGNAFLKHPALQNDHIRNLLPESAVCEVHIFVQQTGNVTIQEYSRRSMITTDRSPP
jgi:hypothetical protein